MSTPGLPMQPGDAGAGVRDLHRRLAAVGYPVEGDPDTFTEATAKALREFQASRRLVEDGVCARQTWSALVEAHHRLGDRMLYLRSPMTRGDDVTDLQQRLGSLGFDAGYVDGIFGPMTEDAVRGFQSNQGVTPDGVAGPDTIQALQRLAGRSSGEKTVAEVREEERLRRLTGDMHGRRLVLGEAGGLPTVIDTIARRLRNDGANVLTLHQPDLSAQAKAANDWDGALYLGVTLAVDDCSVAYFATEGFVSAGGRTLSTHVSDAISAVINTTHQPAGMRIPILRETRMPAVWCRIGPPAVVVERGSALANAMADAITAWCADPSGMTSESA